MTALADLLAARIRASRPLTLAEYMADCLLHPEHGYYATRDPFGARGDFTTAPEISQMFGEMLGLCLAQYWLDLGRPSPFTLAEVGPGRGTLMADVLRATRGVPGFHAAAKVILVEASATLRRHQAQTLSAYQVEWLAAVEALPDAPLFLLANEFFDALPIRQFTRAEQGWSETLVGLSPEGALALGRGDPMPVPALSARLADTAPGDVVEICPAAPAIVHAITQRIASHGGLALIIDYGGWNSRGDTFQALYQHAFADPLAAPGEADLTAHVDFRALAAAASSWASCAYTTQGELLTALGIETRAAQLAAKLQGAARETHLAALERLTHPSQMGKLFKALALYPRHALLPPGFPEKAKIHA